jgi:hypothetical protein
VKPAQEQRRTERIAKEIAATLFITKPYDLNLPFGRSKSTSYFSGSVQPVWRNFAAHYRPP